MKEVEQKMLNGGSVCRALPDPSVRPHPTPRAGAPMTAEPPAARPREVCDHNLQKLSHDSENLISCRNPTDICGDFGREDGSALWLSVAWRTADKATPPSILHLIKSLNIVVLLLGYTPSCSVTELDDWRYILPIKRFEPCAVLSAARPAPLESSPPILSFKAGRRRVRPDRAAAPHHLTLAPPRPKGRAAEPPRPARGRHLEFPLRRPLPSLR